MRVLHVIASLAEKKGGPSAALYGLAVAQRQQGLEVAVLTANQDAAVARESELEAAGIDVVRLPPTHWSAALAARPTPTLQAAVSMSDIVHIHGVWEHLLFQAASVANAVGVPYLIRSCGMLDEWALQRKPLKKYLYIWWRLTAMLEKAAAVHCTTTMEAKSTARLRARFRQVIVEPNGVTIDEFEPLPPRGHFRAAYGIGDRPLVVFLGRVHPGKGVEYLLAAIPLLRTLDVVVAIIGPDDSAFAAEMKENAAAAALKGRVIFTGLVRGRDRIEPLVDADVFALPSEHENFGVAVIEALAAGCPVVVSEHVGLAEEVVNRGVGSACSLAPASIAARLDEWLSHRQTLRHPFTQARQYALATFDWCKVAERWRGHYERMAM